MKWFTLICLLPYLDFIEYLTTFMSLYYNVLLTDTGSTKGERLSVKLRSLSGANEPYESSSNKEIGKVTCRTFPEALFFWSKERKNCWQSY